MCALLVPAIMRPPRPLGVVILAVLQLVSGIGDVFIGILLLFRYVDLSTLGGGLIADASLLLGTLALGLGIFSFVLSFGLWTGKGWAWNLSVIGAVIGLVLGALGIVVGGLTADSLTDLIPIVLSALILAYLNTNSVRAYFGRHLRMPLLRPTPPMMPQPYPPTAQPTYPPPATQQPYYPQPQPEPLPQPAPWSVTACPNCGTPFQLGANFCDRCGTRLR